MRDVFKRHGKAQIFSDELQQAMAEVKARDEQTIILLNRRGYSSSLQCPLCGFVAECPNCSVSLTYHRQDQKLRCHICAYEAPVPAVCPNAKCRNPEIRYAKSGDVHIAYQVFGNGPQNLVIIPGFISHVEHVWDSPDQAAWFNHLAARTRVVMFDKRGTGLSDRLGQLPNLDQRMDDARAVMDAAGSERAAIMGVSEGGSLAALLVVESRSAGCPGA